MPPPQRHCPTLLTVVHDHGLSPAFPAPGAAVMSNSSPDASPTSATGGGRTFSMSRDQFSIDVPMPHLTLTTNSNTNSPNAVKSPNARRVTHFSREGILGSAQKARNLSQSSGERESMTNGLQNGNRQNSEDATNPLKRRSTDGAVDYPRRRATIAVGYLV